MSATARTVARPLAEHFGEVPREALADRLARRIRAAISSGDYVEGDRLPSIPEMARRFDVGPPTVREAIKKLQTLGMVDVRHGSGVYVARGPERLVLAPPGLVSLRGVDLLADVIEARIPLELDAVRLACMKATDAQLDSMRGLLETASDGPSDERALTRADGQFHRQIALATGNAILVQMLDALRDLFTVFTVFTDDGRVVRSEALVRDRDASMHRGILDAIVRRDTPLAVDRMAGHLASVREAVGTDDRRRRARPA